MNVKGRVSVIIPTYNRCRVIARAIESVLAQDYSNFEVIIVDDGSIDNTKEIVEKYIQFDERIKFTYNVNTKGPAGARNTGLQIAEGEYIAFLDSDDEWMVSHLSDAIKIMQSKGVEVCFGLWDEKNLNGERYARFGSGDSKKRFEKLLNDLQPECIDEYIIFDSRFVEYVILNRFYCYHINTLVIKKNKINESGLFNEKLGTNEDLDFTIRLFDISKICCIKKCQFVYYQGTDNLYCFMDRKIIDLREITRNNELVQRMVYCDLNKAEMFKLRKKFILESKIIHNKKECIQECNDRIAKKYFTVGVLYHKARPVFACYNILKSIRYEFKFYKVQYLYYIWFDKEKCVCVDNEKLYYT